MKRSQIKSLFQSLAYSQGFYGRLLRDIENLDKVEQNSFWQHLENQNFKSNLDVILYIEG